MRIQMLKANIVIHSMVKPRIHHGSIGRMTFMIPTAHCIVHGGIQVIGKRNTAKRRVYGVK